MSAPRVVRCPGCGGPSVYAPENRFRPFCSERCHNIDLGAWADESYRIGTPASQVDEPDEPSAPPATPH